jgi:diguanylate cyclase (GGDEF)-like protein
MQEIPLSDVMTHDVELIAPDTPVREVVHRMHVHRHSCVFVGRDGVPEGIITERDLVQVLAGSLDEQNFADHSAEQIMTSPLHTVNISQSLFDALVISRAERIRHLPVVDADHKLAGIVTYINLAEAHFHVVELQRDVIEHAVESRTEELREANQELRALSLEDALLGIGNRRAMEVDLEHTHAVTTRYQHVYTVALLDIDYFKLYNDHYGHLAGDDCLKAVTDFIKNTIRGSDRLYRYGGEEFLLLLPETDAQGAQILCQRLVEDLCRLALPHDRSPHKVVTMSAGIASASSESGKPTAWRDIVELADTSLYRAKCGGRNQIACLPESAPGHCETA